MAENEKRIVLRVDPEKWHLFDDKRHAERTSFQELGLRLFNQWFSGEESAKKHDEKIKIPKLRDKLHGTGHKEADLGPESERGPWVTALESILQSGNEIAIRALKSNLMAFSDYVRAVPEVSDGLADLAADEVRIAGVKQRLVDARKAAAMGTPAAPAKGRRRASEEAVRKRS